MIKVKYPPQALKNITSELKRKLKYARQLSKEAQVKPEMFGLYDEVDREISAMATLVETSGFSTKYANKYCRALEELCHTFSSDFGSQEAEERGVAPLQDTERDTFKRQQERNEDAIRQALDKFKETADFFSKLDFLSRDVVIIGANGSGKTVLATELKNHIEGDGVIVSAEKILHIPNFDSILGVGAIAQQLKNVQVGNLSGDGPTLEEATQHFAILLQSLLARDVEDHKEYKRQARLKSKEGSQISAPPATDLELTLDIWNSVFVSVQLQTPDGMNIMAFRGEAEYPADEMSDGEKVGLFLIAHALQAPADGFIIVDEPEMYLHRTIHQKLWNILEVVREDCTFVYLTHDLEFASSRINGKKLWLRCFTYPNKFTIEDIPASELPKPLLLELIGSRHTILFCEGNAGSLDEALYTILFPEYVVKAVGGCARVIHFTKALNQIPFSTAKAIGIIDADYHSEARLKALESENIFGLRLPEVENLLFDEKILHAVGRQHGQAQDKVGEIKNKVLELMSREKLVQVSNFVSAKVDHYLKDANVPRANDISALKTNFTDFLKNVEIERWAHEREESFEKIIAEKDFDSAIRILHHKRLEEIANATFRIKNYNRQALELLQGQKELQDALLKYFPFNRKEI
jgi:ABC-type Mn2+/Zn2+ transport system ATPase subunit